MVMVVPQVGMVHQPVSVSVSVSVVLLCDQYTHGPLQAPACAPGGNTVPSPQVSHRQARLVPRRSLVAQHLSGGASGGSGFTLGFFALGFFLAFFAMAAPCRCGQGRLDVRSVEAARYLRRVVG